jgi:hypothetical protein
MPDRNHADANHAGIGLADEVMLILTVEGPETVLKNGGSLYWRVAKWRAERCRYAILVQNAHKAQEMRGSWDFATGTEADDVAFFVGRGLHPVQEDHDRWLIRFDEFARVRVPSFWTGDRYPIRYLSMDAVRSMGLDPEGLRFQPMPEPAAPVAKLTIAEAKRGLAAQFQVPESSVEIVIRA